MKREYLFEDYLFVYLGLEMLNHAITGYACFLSSQTLRKDFQRNIRIIIEKFRRKNSGSIIQLSSSS
jgi:hypothetical protein